MSQHRQSPKVLGSRESDVAAPTYGLIARPEWGYGAGDYRHNRSLIEIDAARPASPLRPSTGCVLTVQVGRASSTARGYGARNGWLEAVRTLARGEHFLDTDELESGGRELIDNGRPDLLVFSTTDISWSSFAGKPWARLAIAAALIARNPRDPLGMSAIESAKSDFAAREDSEGLGYCAYVAGTRNLGAGEFRDAATNWRNACELLGERTPVGAHALTHLSLTAYHDGDLKGAAELADDAVGLARLRSDRRGEGLALIYRGLISLGIGEFGECLVAADAADELFAQIADVSDRYEWPLAAAERVGAYGHRRDVDSALIASVEALRRAEEVGTRWYAGITLAVRAEFCAHADPEQSLADGRAALDILREAGDPWWESCALRALGIATDVLGHPNGSIRLLREAAQLSPGVFERARSDLELADVYVRQNRMSDARPLLDACADVFRRAPADFLLCRTLRMLALVEPARGATWRAEALKRRRGDLAFDQIFDDRWAGGRLIRVRCIGQTDVTLDGEPAHFLTHNAERAFLMLALAGERGVHQEVLSEALWPGAPADRVGQRIRTLLWQVRKALGGDAWHIRRRGQIVYLDPIDVAVDLHAAFDEAEALAAVTEPSTEDEQRRLEIAGLLEHPVLGPYQYELWAESWIMKAQSLGARLRTI